MRFSMTIGFILNDFQFHSQWESISLSLTFSFILNENQFDCHWLLNPLSLTFSLILIDFLCGLGLSWSSKRLEWGGWWLTSAAKRGWLAGDLQSGSLNGCWESSCQSDGSNRKKGSKVYKLLARGSVKGVGWCCSRKDEMGCVSFILTCGTIGVCDAHVSYENRMSISDCIHFNELLGE